MHEGAYVEALHACVEAIAVSLTRLPSSFQFNASYFFMHVVWRAMPLMYPVCRIPFFVYSAGRPWCTFSFIVSGCGASTGTVLGCTCTIDDCHFVFYIAHDMCCHLEATSTAGPHAYRVGCSPPVDGWCMAVALCVACRWVL